MAMTRGTALVATVARVVQLTGQQDLASLEDAAELTLTDLLVTASDMVYDRLEADGHDPTLLSNQAIYEIVVAYNFLGLLRHTGYLRQDLTEDFWVHAENLYVNRRPAFAAAAGAEGAVSNQAIPLLGNVDKHSLVDRNIFYDDLPDLR